jgi:hypothetical protein
MRYEVVDSYTTLMELMKQRGADKASGLSAGVDAAFQNRQSLCAYVVPVLPRHLGGFAGEPLRSIFSRRS